MFLVLGSSFGCDLEESSVEEREPSVSYRNDDENPFCDAYDQSRVRIKFSNLALGVDEDGDVGFVSVEAHNTVWQVDCPCGTDDIVHLKNGDRFLSKEENGPLVMREAERDWDVNETSSDPRKFSFQTADGYISALFVRGEEQTTVRSFAVEEVQ